MLGGPLHIDLQITPKKNCKVQPQVVKEVGGGGMGMCDRMCFWKYPDATQCPMCHQMCFGGQYSYILFMFVNLGAYPAHCSIFVFF